jgi:hypothetical protein
MPGGNGNEIFIRLHLRRLVAWQIACGGDRSTGTHLAGVSPGRRAPAMYAARSGANHSQDGQHERRRTPMKKHRPRKHARRSEKKKNASREKLDQRRLRRARRLKRARLRARRDRKRAAGFWTVIQERREWWR